MPLRRAGAAFSETVGITWFEAVAEFPAVFFPPNKTSHLQDVSSARVFGGEGFSVTDDSAKEA